MRLFAVGLSHRTAPVELRECVDFARGGARRGAGGAGRARRQPARRWCCRPATAPRSTRSRDSDAAADAIGAVLQRIPRARRARGWPQHLYVQRGAEAARHLFRVAAGLDSLVVGEPQILGQVKAAYADRERPAVHRRRSPTGCSTRRSRVGKRVRRETGLGEGAVSVSYAAIALAKKIFGDLTGLNVADSRRRRDGQADRHPPAGAAGQADHHREPHAGDRRARSRAQLDGRAVPWSELGDALAAADIVVTATGAAEPVLTRASRRGGDAAAAQPAAVHHRHRACRATSKPPSAISIRCSSTTSTTCRRSSRRTWRGAARELDQRRGDRRRGGGRGSRRGCSRARSSRRWSRCAQRFEAIRQAELARLEPKLAGLPPEARARVDEITQPHRREAAADADRAAQVGQRREPRSSAYADALNRLFRLAAEEQARSARRAGHACPQVGRRVTHRAAPDRHARQPARAVAGARRRRRGSKRTASPSRSCVIKTAAIACRPRRCPRSAASGCSSRRSRTRCSPATSTSRCTAPRTCRRCCPTGSTIAATLPREDPRDALVLPAGRAAGRRRGGARSSSDERRAIGTGSVRRIAQLRRVFPARGLPADPRQRRHAAAEARRRRVRRAGARRAGLRRLGFGERISAALPVDECVPAPGQGIIAIEIRADDDAQPRAALERMHDAAAGAALDAERAVVDGARRRLPAAARRAWRGARRGDARACRRSSRRSTARGVIRAHARGGPVSGRGDARPRSWRSDLRASRAPSTILERGTRRR